MYKRIMVILILVTIATVALPACAQATPAPPIQEEEDLPPAEEEDEELVPLKVAISGFQDVISLKIAEQKGWFEEAGLDVELIEADWAEAH